ncbi:MAG: DNA polymerase III subunit alpha, partial [Phycisphaerales bacterium]|nr:DNA polymerase III subunit alpha [Phycisphaerales bacterium]
ACCVPVVATNGVRFHDPTRRQLHDVLTAIRCGTTVSAVGFATLPNAERHLRDGACMHARWRECPQAIERGLEIAERCRGFSLSSLRYHYPSEVVPVGTTAMDHLRAVTDRGAHERYPQGIPTDVQQQIAYEFALIDELGYANYFLTVFDLVRFARSRGILCQGRGAAANSAVCYCLGVTAVDPARTKVLFERFISRERNEPPDIDIDFEHERREEVMQYIFTRYGRMRAALCAEVVCYRRRLAVRETAKALGFSLDAVDRLVRGLPTSPTDEDIRALGFDPTSAAMVALICLAAELEGFPRHLSQHSGGFIITEGPLCELVPIREATMDGRTMIEWDKDDIDAMGMLKIDVLALGILTCIRKALELAGMAAELAPQCIEQTGVRELALHTIPPEDPATYAMMTRADTVGVFQIESRAQMSMLPRLRPQNYYDLVIEVAIVRPGPIQGDMVHPYLRRRCGAEVATYPSEAVREILERTLGVPLFQEQAMRLAIVAAGFTPGEADQLRRAIAAWKRNGNQLAQFQEKLETGMIARGYSTTFAKQVFIQIQGFSGYGFPESHAASFAHLVYASAWLKCHHPAAFTCALLNSQPMGFYAPAQLVMDAQRHGVTVLPIDVNCSQWDCTLEQQSSPSGHPSLRLDRRLDFRLDRRLDFRLGLRLGLRMIRGLVEEDGRRIAATRAAHRVYTSVDDLWRASGVSIRTMRQLARADAFRSIDLDRQAALWQAQRLRIQDAPLFTTTACHEPPDTTDALPPMSAIAHVTADYEHSGLSLKAHPISFAREWLTKRGVTSCEQTQCALTFPCGSRTAIAGLVLVRQRPATAKGIVFVTIEDETGSANLIIRPKVWERVRSVGRFASAIVAHGTIERRNECTHLIVSHLEALIGVRQGEFTTRHALDPGSRSMSG